GPSIPGRFTVVTDLATADDVRLRRVGNPATPQPPGGQTTRRAEILGSWPRRLHACYVRGRLHRDHHQLTSRPPCAAGEPRTPPTRSASRRRSTRCNASSGGFCSGDLQVAMALRSSAGAMTTLPFGG